MKNNGKAMGIIMYYDSKRGDGANEEKLLAAGYEVMRFYDGHSMVQELIHCTSKHDERACRLGKLIMILTQRHEKDRTEVQRLRDFMRYQFDHHPSLIMILNNNNQIKSNSWYKQVPRIELTTDDMNHIASIFDAAGHSSRLKQIIQMHPSKFESISSDDYLSVNFRPLLETPAPASIRSYIFNWDFYAHNFDYDQLTWLAQEMFCHCLYGPLRPQLEEFLIPRDHILSFLLIVRESYHSKNPYHNFRHAIDVLQATFYFLVQIGALPNQDNEFNSTDGPFSAVDALVLLIVAVGHDVGHPGVTNAFLCSINSPLSRIYNDKSVLESFHSASFCQILQRHWPMMTKNPQAKAAIVESIISTDMGLHFKYMDQLQTLVDTPANGINLSTSRSLLCCVIIKCADVSNVARHLDISAKWGGVLTKEFSELNAHEIDFGLKEPPDANTSPPDPQLALAKGQVFFINTYARPLFSAVAKIFPPLQFTIDIIESNCTSWQNKI